MGKRGLVACCAVLVLAAGCGHGRSQAGPAPTMGPLSSEAATTAAVPTTTTSVVIDPTTPPATVDLAYINAVMAELNTINAQLVELVLTEHRVSLQAQQLARAVFAGPALGQTYEEAATVARRPPDDFKRPVGPFVTTAQRFLSNAPTCVSFVGPQDNSQAVTDPHALVVAIALKPKDPKVDGAALNPTPWVMSDNFAAVAPASPKNDPCTG